MLKQILTTLFSDVRRSIVSSIVGAVLLSLGGILYLSKTALSYSLAILTAPAQTWGILVLVLVVIFVYIRLKVPKNSYRGNDLFKIHKTITLALNDYQEIELKPGHAFKVELKEIKKDVISYPYLVINGKNENKEKDVAVINFDRMYQLSPGLCVKQVDENEINEGETFCMPKYTSFKEEDVSVFSFSITNTSDDMNFFRCLVKHINPGRQEVELDIYYMRLEIPGSNDKNKSS